MSTSRTRSSRNESVARRSGALLLPALLRRQRALLAAAFAVTFAVTFVAAARAEPAAPPAPASAAPICGRNIHG